MDFHLSKEHLLVRKMYRENSMRKIASPWRPSKRWPSSA